MYVYQRINTHIYIYTLTHTYVYIYVNDCAEASLNTHPHADVAQQTLKDVVFAQCQQAADRPQSARRLFHDHQARPTSLALRRSAHQAFGEAAGHGHRAQESTRSRRAALQECLVPIRLSRHNTCQEKDNIQTKYERFHVQVRIIEPNRHHRQAKKEPLRSPRRDSRATCISL